MNENNVDLWILLAVGFVAVDGRQADIQDFDARFGFAALRARKSNS